MAVIDSLFCLKIKFEKLDRAFIENNITSNSTACKVRIILQKL